MTKHGPWKILSSSIKHQDHWVTVTTDKVIQPDKKSGSYTTIKLVPGVIVVAVDENEILCLEKEFNYVLGKDVLKPVTGGIEPGMTPLATAKKELKEEF